MSEKPARIPPLALVGTITTARASLSRLHRRMAPGGVNVMELPTGDLEMLIAVGGKESTRTEWSDLLSRAGFRLDRVIPTATPVSIVEASPA